MKDLTTEQRLLLALVLSVVVVTLSDLFLVRRTAPAQPGAPVSGQVLPSEQTSSSSPTPSSPSPTTPPATTPAGSAATAPLQAVAAGNEQTIVVENDFYRVELSNSGGVVHSWELKRFHDNSRPPRILDVVHPPTDLASGEWPLSLLLVDPKLQANVNTALYRVKSPGVSLRAPAEVDFTWSDGHLAVTKQIEFGYDYLVQLRTSVTLDGQPVAYAVAWRGGFGDQTAENAAAQIEVFYSDNGKLNLLASKKLGANGHPDSPTAIPGSIEFAGVEDHYFAAAFLPIDAQANAWDWRTDREPPGESRGTTETVAEVAVGAPESSPGPVGLRLYVGPKSLGELGRVNPQLHELVQYGWFGFIAVPLFDILQYIHRYVPNYGWAIVVLTLLINMALFPLKVSSWRSMQKMQRVMPEMKGIQARYKKYPMRDPHRQKMNEEMMELYRREGINPMGSCLPMVIQMPIWFALYRMLEVSIELRHAPWFGWIHDLSAHDPYFILPILMVVTMYVMQKMTPSTTPDPTQQKMMNYMPVFFGVLFFRLSSGLIVYIFSSNLVGIVQQWYLNKTAPVAGRAKRQADA